MKCLVQAYLDLASFFLKKVKVLLANINNDVFTSIVHLIVGYCYFVAFTMVNIMESNKPDLWAGKKSGMDFFPVLGELRDKMMTKKEKVPETSEFLNQRLKRMLGTDRWTLK